MIQIEVIWQHKELGDICSVFESLFSVYKSVYFRPVGPQRLALTYFTASFILYVSKSVDFIHFTLSNERNKLTE